MADPVRILFLADTHLGFDAPARPRAQRRHRGPEFMHSLEQALAPARAGKVDLVVHGGDLFFRSRVRLGVVMEALDRLRPIAERGIPILIVPGNHERSQLPYPLLWTIPGVFIFDRPRTFDFTLRGSRVLLAGLPYSPDSMSRAFPKLVQRATHGDRDDQGGWSYRGGAASAA